MPLHAHWLPAICRGMHIECYDIRFDRFFFQMLNVAACYSKCHGIWLPKDFKMLNVAAWFFGCLSMHRRIVALSFTWTLNVAAYSLECHDMRAPRIITTRWISQHTPLEATACEGRIWLQVSTEPRMPRYASFETTAWVKKITVDAPFCSDYLFRFNFCWTLGLFVAKFEFGHRTYLIYFILFILSSLWVILFSYLFRVYFISNRYLSLNAMLYRVLFFIFIYVKYYFIYF